MTRVDIENLRDLAVLVSKSHDEVEGLCGIGQSFIDGKMVPSVQMRFKSFSETFKIYERKEYTKEYDEAYICLDGVRFFALVEREEE